MNNWFQRRLEIAEMNSNSQSVAMKYFWLFSTQVAQAQIVSTFLVLFLLDILTYTELGLLLAIQFAIIALLDYPTGALGDAIGQKAVLMLAYGAYAIAIVFLLQADSLIGFFPWAIFSAIGASQESGALQSWFDNNYKVTIGDLDPDRKIYGAFLGKIQANWRLISGTMFIAGGVIAGAFSREILFRIQFCLVLVALGLIITLMNNEEGVEAPQRTLRAYFDRLTGGVRFAASSRGTLLFFLGLTVYGTTGAIWGSLMLFPFYASYSGPDEYTGLLRAILFLTGIILLLLMANLTKKIEKPHRVLFLSNFMVGFVFFCLVFGFYEVIPPPNKFVLNSYLAVIILFQWVGIWLPLQTILQGRLMLELVPDKYRNAVYSLIPSLILCLSVPLIAVGGFLISNQGFSAGILFIVGLDLVAATFLGLGLYWLAKPRPIEFPPGEDMIEPLQEKIPTQVSG
ncbi:MAG: MFS transporter [Candidatus Thorarchaeota archaeon]